MGGVEFFFVFAGLLFVEVEWNLYPGGGNPR